jgi:hypothetical protein
MASKAKKSWAPAHLKLGVPSAITKQRLIPRPQIKRSKVRAQDGDAQVIKVGMTKGSNVPVPQETVEAAVNNAEGNNGVKKVVYRSYQVRKVKEGLQIRYAGLKQPPCRFQILDSSEAKGHRASLVPSICKAQSSFSMDFPSIRHLATHPCSLMLEHPLDGKAPPRHPLPLTFTILKILLFQNCQGSTTREHLRGSPQVDCY